MTGPHEEFWDDLFHGCAVAAYVDQAAAEWQWPPECEATKRRAYRYYEDALAARKEAKALEIANKLANSEEGALDPNPVRTDNVSYDTFTGSGGPEHD